MKAPPLMALALARGAGACGLGPGGISSKASTARPAAAWPAHDVGDFTEVLLTFDPPLWDYTEYSAEAPGDGRLAIRIFDNIHAAGSGLNASIDTLTVGEGGPPCTDGTWGQTGLIAVEPDGETAWLTIHPDQSAQGGYRPAVDSRGIIYQGAVERADVGRDPRRRHPLDPPGGSGDRPLQARRLAR